MGFPPRVQIGVGFLSSLFSPLETLFQFIYLNKYVKNR